MLQRCWVLNGKAGPRSLERITRLGEQGPGCHSLHQT